MIRYETFERIMTNRSDCLNGGDKIGLHGDSACTIPVIRFFDDSDTSLFDTYLGHDAFEENWLDVIGTVKNKSKQEPYF